MDDLRDSVNRLSDRVQWLEERVAILEGLSQMAASHLPRCVTTVKQEPAADEFALPKPAGIFPVIGKAMLGIAGAYLLRAISESGAVPQLVIVVIALTYAATWLIWATRATVSTQFVSLTYAITAALIVVPMLVELTLRFHILSSGSTSALLIAFALASALLAWTRKLLGIVWVGVATAVCTSIALMVLSRDMAPYLSVLLVTVLVSEGAAARNRWFSLRGLVGPASDVAVWNFIYTFSLSASARIDYIPVPTLVLLAIPSLLFLLYGASIAFRTVWARERISTFEVIQTTVSCVLAGLAWFWFAQRTGMTILGLACCLLAIGGYGAAVVSLKSAAIRNYHVYAAWSAALMLTGTFLLLKPVVASVSLSALALTMTVVAVRAQRLMPALQAFAYLVAAAFTSGLVFYVFSALAGALPDLPSFVLWIVAGCVIVCSAVAGKLPGRLWNQLLLRMIFAVLSVSVITAFFVSGLIKLTAQVILPTAPSIAALRTLIIAVFVLLLAFAAGRWGRTDLMWSAYGGLAFLTAKLLLEDLRTSRSGYIAVSVFLYAVVLILTPRLGRAARQHAENLQTRDAVIGSRPEYTSHYDIQRNE